ncbi:hypothetical protein [Rubeoparvulum massiliense]|uniref:hypothetical protein n=1 Tax=Rubeoparvulum massiliense TaxID=1631346 RepID=UPI00065E8629|nr:hypothetical protein [Rubeoparvulum massiliense]
MNVLIRKEERIISSHRQQLFIGFILLVLLCFWTIAWINPIVYSSSGPFSPKDFSDPTDLKPTFIPTPQEPLSNGSSDAGIIENPALNHEPSSPSTWELVQRSLGEVITITWDTLAAGGRIGWTMGTEWLQTQVIQPTTYQFYILSQGEVSSSSYWQAFFQLTLSLGIVGVGALLSWGMVGRQALFSSIGAMTAGGRVFPWLAQILYGSYGGAGFWASIRSATGGAIGGGITRFLGSAWRTFHTSRLFTLISGTPGSTRFVQLMRGLQAEGSSFGRGASRLGTGFTSVASSMRRIRPWTGWSSWGVALTNTVNQLREGLALRFWKERGWGRGKPASTHGPQRGGGYASAQWTPTVGRNPGMKPQAMGKSRVTATGISFRTVSSVLPDPDYSPSVDPQLLALLERYNQEDSQEKALISPLKLYLSQLGLLQGEEYIEGQGYSDQYTPELYNAIKDLQLLLNVFGDDLLLREEGRYHLEVNGEMDQDLVDMARTLASQGYPLGDWLALLQDPDDQEEKWKAYEAYLQANGWDVLQLKEFLRITGFLQVEGELTAHYDLDTHAALLRFLQAHNEESSFDEMVQWDWISLIPLVLLEHLKKKGEANRLYYGKHKKGIWDFIVGFMLGFTKGAVSLTAGFAIFAGGTLKFLFNMVFRPFKTGKEAFEALCRIPGAIVNLFKAIKVAYQEKVINGNLFTMGEFFGWATFEGTAIVIPIGIAKELSLLARFENWLIRLRLPQKGILGLLTHGTRNVAVYAVRGMRMVEQKIYQGIRFVVLRLTILLRTMWGKIKGNFERVTEYL